MSLLARLLVVVAFVRRVLGLGPRARPADPPAPEPDPSEHEVMANRRMETLAALLLFASAGFGVAFVVLYVVYDATTLLGASGGLALVCLAAALFLVSARVVPQIVEVEDRGELDHGPEAHEDVADDLRGGFEGVSRRRLLTGAAGACACGLGVMAAAPLASLGPRIEGTLADSPWRRGRALVDSDDKLISADALEVGSFVTGFPQGADKRELGSPVVVVRIDPRDLRLPRARADWAPEGLLAYSKICTHAGCAVAEFRWPLYEPTAPGAKQGLVCPCHYSTFDVADGGSVTFGPAGRPLPQLPLAIDGSRNLRAAGPLSGPPGPAWWGVAH